MTIIITGSSLAGAEMYRQHDINILCKEKASKGISGVTGARALLAQSIVV